MSPRGKARQKCGDRGVLEIAVAIHGASCGSGEWYPEIESDVRILEDVIRAWEPTHWEPSRIFDDSVKAVLEAAIAEFAEYKERLDVI